MPSSAKSRPISQSMSSSTIVPPTSIPKACPRKGGGAGLAGAPSALDLPLHPDLGLLAQRGRELLLKDDAATHPPRRLPLDRRPAGRHQCLSPRAQCQPQTVRLDQIRRRHSGQTRPMPCIIRLIQCTSGGGFYHGPPHLTMEVALAWLLLIVVLVLPPPTFLQ